MSRYLILILMLTALLGVVTNGEEAWAQVSYTIARYTVNSSSQSSGGDYSMRATIGQATTGRISGGEFTLTRGYWQAAPAEAGNVYLPSLQQ